MEWKEVKIGQRVTTEMFKFSGQMPTGTVMDKSQSAGYNLIGVYWDQNRLVGYLDANELSPLVSE